MRKDLNKQLCERERSGSSKKYREVRHNKKFKLDLNEDGSNAKQESMTYRYGYDTKNFNENLTPLKGQVRKAVGKRWDTFYSEFCKNFDMRSVINQHILQHLDQYCERGIIVKDGELYIRNENSYRDGKLRDSNYVEFYVDPRDGIIKRNKWYKNKKRQQATEPREKVKIEIDKDNVLHFIEGVWFHFTLKDIAPGHYEYKKPETVDTFNISYRKDRPKLKTWDQLDEYERKKFGEQRYIGEVVTDVFTGDKLRNSTNFATHSKKRYHATKRTASHNLLKKAGII